MTQPLIHGSQIDQTTLDGVPGGFLGSVWRYQDDVASADPGNGNFRLNNLTTASATEIYISATTDDNHDFGAILAGLRDGDRLYIQDQADSTRSLLLTITSTVDNTGWWTIVFTVDDSSGAFDDDKKCSLLLFFGSNSINSVVEDTTPQLGGNLDVNGNSIASVSNANINITPDGTGNVLLGSFEFNADQSVGAGQDNFVLTYDNSSGEISLEATAGGGSPDEITDADGDTKIQVEEIADEDTIRFDLGSNVTGWPALANALVFSSGQFTLTFPQANVAATEGSTINLTAGQGNTSGNGGPLNLTAGEGGGSAGGLGGAVSITGGAGGSAGGQGGGVVITSGAPATGAYRGGDIEITAAPANGGQTGGNVEITSGKGGASGGGGSIDLQAGDGGATSGQGGNINITCGDGDGSSRGGDMTLTAGNAGYGLGGDIEIIGGDGFGSYVGGNVDLTAGTGGLIGPGGAVVISGGDGGATGDFGGAVTIKAGTGTAAFVGGNVTLEGGEASTGDEGIVMVRGAFGLEHQALGTITSATDIDPDAGMTAHFTFGAAATAEIGFTASLESGVSYEMTVEITNGGQGTMTWGSEVEWDGGAPTLTAAGKDLLKFWTRDSGTTWLGWVVALDLT